MPVYSLGSTPTKKSTIRPLSDIALSGVSSKGGTASNGITSTKKSTVSTNTNETNSNSQWVYKNKSTGEISSTPRGGEEFWTKIPNPNYKAPAINQLGYYGINDALTDAEASTEEAKQKTEASKASALGYFNQLEADANKLYNTDVISADQQQQALNKKRNDLAVSGQNLLGAFGDADSGIQSGVRRNIALNTANMASNLPIETQLEINNANRIAKIQALGQRYNIAQAKSGIEQSYDYDPGNEYIAQLGEALGESSGSSGSSSSSGSNSSGNSTVSIYPNSWENYKGKGTKKGIKTPYGYQLLNSDGSVITSSGVPIYI